MNRLVAFPLRKSRVWVIIRDEGKRKIYSARARSYSTTSYIARVYGKFMALVLFYFDTESYFYDVTF